MRDTLENKLSMYEAVLTVLNDNAAITGTVPAFAPAITEFQAAVDNAKVQEQKRIDARKGKTATKHADEDALIAVAMKIANALRVHGRRTNDERLKEVGGITRSYLYGLRDAALPDYCQVVHDTADPIAIDLADYGITPADITDLQDRITAYRQASGDSVGGLAVQVSARIALEAAFRTADDVLKNDLDPLVDMLRETQPDFYNTYIDARVIRDIGVRHENPPTS